MIRPLLPLLLICLVGCCTPPSPPTTAPAPEPVQPTIVPTTANRSGGTTMARSSRGYELRNRWMRVLIDGPTGDVVEWGTPGQPRNTVAGRRGLYATVAGLPESPPVGYVEKRDDQTWHYYGTDANGVTWRKVYNLDHDSLLVSYVFQNTRATPLPAAVQIRGEMIGARILAHDPEQFTATSGYGTVSLHGWNVAHDRPPPSLPVLLQSDTFNLQPGEREGYTTEWRIDP